MDEHLQRKSAVLLMKSAEVLTLCAHLMCVFVDIEQITDEVFYY